MLLFLLTLAASPFFPIVGQEELPSLAPVVNSIFPHGAQQGSTVEVDFLGQDLHEAQSLRFVGSDVQAEILSASSKRLRARIRVAPQAEVGRRDFRLRTPYGSFVGVFDIGSLREINEVEPNDNPHKAQKISPPVLANGVIKSEDFDHFQLRVDEGETVFFDVNAARNGSKLDANLAILDDEGRELVWTDDDYIYGDPRIEYRFEKGGDYVVRVGSLAGSPTSDYRLVVGRLPYLSLVLPAGIKRGGTSELLIQGSFLEDTQKVWLADHLAEGTLLSRSADSIRVRMEIPESVPTGKHWLHVATSTAEAPLPIPLVVSDIPEITVAEEPLNRERPMKIEAPVVVSGILAAPRESHYFRFKAVAQQRFLFRVDSMEYGYHLDPVITLLDVADNKLDFADDPGRDERTDEIELDPHLSYHFKQGGDYVIAVRDSMHRGDARFVYRLTVQPTDPDFILEVREPLKTAYIGEKAGMLLRVRRRGGWNTPVEVWAEGLPKGVFFKKRIVQPKDSVVKDTCGVDRVADGSILTLPILVAPEAAPGLHQVVVKARGVMEGRSVEHEAQVFYEHLASGYFFGPMQEQLIDLTIAPPPKVIFDVPHELALEVGKTALLKVTVKRFRDARDSPLYLAARDLPDGVTVEPALLKPKMKEVTLTLAALPEARGVKLPIRLTAASSSGGEVVAESPPIFLKVIADGGDR